MRYAILICILVLLTALTSNGQTSPGESLIFLNDVKVNKGTVDAFDPTEIAFITMVNDTAALDVASSTGTRDAIYVYTKEYARGKYWNYFKQKSPAYANAIPSLAEEKNVAYIVDGEVLKDNIESELYDLIDAEIRLEVIEGKQLKKQFNIKNKKLGVMINTE